MILGLVFVASMVFTATPAAADATPTLKPDIRGLIDDGPMPPTSMDPYIQGIEAATTWALLQPTQADNQALQIVHPNPIDRTVSYVQKYLPQMKVKIRVWTGMQSPAWALNLDGPSFQMNDFRCTTSPQPAGCNGGSLTYTYPRWWGPNFQSAYDRLEQALGVAYDGVAVVAEISSPRCMTYWDEPFVRPWDSWSINNLLNAGYTVSSDVACQQEQLVSQKAAWPHTIVSLAVNPYYDYSFQNGVPAFQLDVATTQSILSFCRRALGEQCLLQNDELGRRDSSPVDANYSPIYPLLQQMGSPLAYMVLPSGLDLSLAQSFSLAVSWGANSVEIAPSYFNQYPPSFFAPYDQQLIANAWGQKPPGVSRVGGLAASSPRATSGFAPGRVDVMLEGTDSAVWHMWTTNNGLTYNWESLGGIATSAPGVAAWGPNRLDLFVRGSDSHLWHRAYDGSWHAWEDLGGNLVGGPAVASWSAGRLDVVVRGTDNAVWRESWDGQRWLSWESLGGITNADPTDVSASNGQLDVFVRGQDNALWHRAFTGANWSAWSSVGGLLTSGPSACSWGGGRLDVFARSSDDAYWHRYWSGSWSAWAGVGGAWSSDPGATSPRSGTIDVFGRGLDGALWEDLLTNQ